MFETVLGLATLLCALVAGFLFAFASVVMPGIQRLDDRDFLRTFQVVDGVIQGNPPVFLIVWLGSVLTLLLSALLGLWQLAGLERLLLGLAAAIYVVGVQLPTAGINVPLNNWLQTLNLESLDGPEISAARDLFESRWIRWNRIRTLLSALTSTGLIVLLLRV
jgi:uncharacterized membrane protein